ncbi:MAG: Na+/H+ antiporter subunit E [Planctomycetota bacterium]
MRHAIALAVCLAAIWIGWSGHFEPLLLTFGAISVGLVLYVSMRMKIVDADGNLLVLAGRMARFAPYLVSKIFRANLDVARIILSPRMPISPRMVRVRTLQETDLARTIYANSVTLTPGTVTVAVEDPDIIVHAITEENAKAFEAGRMNRKVAWCFEDRRIPG